VMAGRPAEYRWRPVRKFGNSIPCTTPQSLADPAAGVPCINAANIGEGKTWTQSEFCTWHVAKLRQGARAPEKCIYGVPAQETAKDHAKFGWPPVSDVGAVTKPKEERRRRKIETTGQKYHGMPYSIERP